MRFVVSGAKEGRFICGMGKDASILPLLVVFQIVIGITISIEAFRETILETLRGDKTFLDQREHY